MGLFEGLLAAGVACGLCCVMCLGSGRGAPAPLQVAIGALWILSIAATVVGLVGLLVGLVTIGRHEEVFPLRCGECGYERKGLGKSVARCPECGNAW